MYLVLLFLLLPLTLAAERFSRVNVSDKASTGNHDATSADEISGPAVDHHQMGTSNAAVEIRAQSDELQSAVPFDGQRSLRSRSSGALLAGNDYCTLANIRCAHLFSGADAGQRIQNAVNDLKSANQRGGIVDARGVTDTVMSGFTVKRGVTVLLPAKEFSLTGTIKVEENAGLIGTDGSGARNQGTLLFPTSAVANRAIWAAPIEVSPERWWHFGTISNIRIQADDMPPGSNCMDVHQMGENASITNMHLQSCKKDGIFMGSPANSAPASQAGANFLGPLAIMAAGGCAIRLQNIAAELTIDGLSGDDDESMLCIHDSQYNGASIVVRNFKSETFTAGRQNPVVDIRNTDAFVNIVFFGGRHTCGVGGCQDFIRIENTTPGTGPFITIMGEFVANYSNLINDRSNNIVIPATIRTGKLNLFTYSGEDSPDVRVWHARGTVRFSNLPRAPRPCSSEQYGAQYFSTPDQRMCVCASDGTDNAWLKSDNHSHSAGHCVQ